MLGKVITLTKTPRSNAGFGPVLRYLFRDGPDHEAEPNGPPPAVEGGVLNLDADLATPEDRRILAECEVVYTVHRDTPHDHVHLLANRIHPVKGTVAGPRNSITFASTSVPEARTKRIV